MLNVFHIPGDSKPISPAQPRELKRSNSFRKNGRTLEKQSSAEDVIDSDEQISQKIQTVLSKLNVGSPDFNLSASIISLASACTDTSNNSSFDFDESRVQNFTCLIVEDSVLQRKLIQRRLQQFAPAGTVWQTHFVQSAEKAVDIIRQFSFDLIIVDQNLSGGGGKMKGSEFIHIVRDELMNTTIVGCTGTQDKSECRKLTEAGAEFLWQKPPPQNSFILINQIIEQVVMKKSINSSQSVVSIDTDCDSEATENEDEDEEDFKTFETQNYKLNLKPLECLSPTPVGSSTEDLPSRLSRPLKSISKFSSKLRANIYYHPRVDEESESSFDLCDSMDGTDCDSSPIRSERDDYGFDSSYVHDFDELLQSEYKHTLSVEEIAALRGHPDFPVTWAPERTLKKTYITGEA